MGGRCSALLVCILAGSARADGPSLNQLTAEEVAEGWILLFDGETAEWRIDGDHEIVDGALILGGQRTTRAYLSVPVVRNCEIRFQYRTEGKESASVGWDTPRIPGIPIPYLSPKEDWHDAFIEEYFDISAFQQRFIKTQHGASGVFAPIEALWVEVPAGNRLFLRNVRMRQGGAASWPLLLVGLAVGLTMVLFLWRWRKKRQKEGNSTRLGSNPTA